MNELLIEELCKRCNKITVHMEDDNGNLFDMENNIINASDVCQCPEANIISSGTECPNCDEDYYYCNCNDKENKKFWNKKNIKINLDAYSDFPWYNKS